MPMRSACNDQAEPMPVNWPFAAAVALVAVYVVLLIAAGADYAANIDALALAGVGGK